MNSYGSKFKITIFGSSHGESLGCVLEGLPNGACIDMQFVRAQLVRRSAASGGEGATQRHEPDEPVLSGGFKASRGDPSKLILDGTPLTATFFNKDVNRSDYGKFARPSHADLVSFVKYGPGHDLSGGGASSGRMTLPLVFAGAVCAGLLNERGIRAFSHVLRIGPVCDRRFDPVSPELPQDCDPYFPLINGSVRLDMERSLADAKQRGDTLSCECECAVTGLPVGLGEPFFGGAESELCRLLFSIPGLRGAEIGEREHIFGSYMNDGFTDGGRTVTNRSGGVNGGISNGMPLVFRAWFRPVPSISLPQQVYDLEKGAPASLRIVGRHDTCILPRGCAAVEAAANICVYELLRCFDER